ncbi:MAG: hypothetical protein AB8C84_07535 [Oligoflexales bacterium]
MSQNRKQFFGEVGYKDAEKGGALLGSLFFVMISGITMLGLSQFQSSDLKRGQQFRDQRMLDQLGSQMERSIQSAAVLRLASYSGKNPPAPNVPFTHVSSGNRALYRCWRHDTDTLDTAELQVDCRHMEIHSFVVPRVSGEQRLALAGVESDGPTVYYTGRGDRCLENPGLSLDGLKCGDRKGTSPLYQAVAEFRARCPEDQAECAIAEFIDVRFLLYNENGRRVYPRGRQNDDDVTPWETISTSTLRGQQCNEGALARSTKNSHLKCECVFPWQPTGRENINGEVCFRVNIQTHHECQPEESVRGFDPKADNYFGKERSRLQCLKPASSRTRTQSFKGNKRGDGGSVQGFSNGDCDTGWVQSAVPVCTARCDVKKKRGDEPDWYESAVTAGLTGLVTVFVLGGGFLPALLAGGALSVLSAVFEPIEDVVNSVICAIGGLFGSGCQSYLSPCVPKVECQLEVTCQDFNYDQF